MKVPATRDQGVYASLDELARLEFKARGFSFLPRQPVHSVLSGRHSSRLRGRGLNFEEIRGYLPGDDIRNIDWKVTARLRKPHVRVYTEERDRPVILVVDQRLPMFFGTRRYFKSVIAAHLAALAAWRVFSAGDRVGALVFNDAGIREIRPHRSRQRVLEILRAVEEQNHELRADTDRQPNYAMLNQAVDRASRTAAHDHLVVIISDFAGADEQTRRHGLRMVQHNDVLASLVYDSMALELPRAGSLVTTSGELQVELNLGDRRIREPIERYSKARVHDVGEFLRKLAVPVLPVHTGEDAIEQVRRMLGQLPQAGGKLRN